MEIKPIKESKENLYPTIRKVKNTRLMGSVLLASNANVSFVDVNEIIELMGGVDYVAVPSYAPLITVKIIRGVTFITAIVFLLLLIKNKIKIKKSINENEEENNKTKKHIKIELCLFIISLIIMIISHTLIMR